MRSFQLSLWFVVTLAATLAVGACGTDGVGDPCEPEQVPAGGFVSTETYLETSSVQCRTRVCMVNRIPAGVNVSSPDYEDFVYCTCRCSAPSSSSVTTCDCPDGFSCEEVLELGGDGLRGGYCTRQLASTTTE